VKFQTLNEATNKLSSSKSPNQGTTSFNRNANKLQQKRELKVLKAKQEVARKAFFAQKLPDVGQLWMHQLLINKKNRKKNLDRLRG
jgi:hypothetical protein